MVESQEKTTMKEDFRSQRRRTRDVKEGRDWVCEICQKSYFQKSALQQHMKIKHNGQELSAAAVASAENKSTEQTHVNSTQILRERVPPEALGGPVDAAKLFSLVHAKAQVKGFLGDRE